MTLNHLKTNSTKLEHYRLKIRKGIEFFDFQSLMKHTLWHQAVQMVSLKLEKFQFQRNTLETLQQEC